jgi:cytochrome c oxidase subunit I+III
VSGVLALITILTWLWTGTSQIPEKPQKNVGLGLTLPLYTSGPSSVGWWGMTITMLADLTAFISLVFGYFFYWTARPNFVPDPVTGPGVFWPAVALTLLLASWLGTLLARRWNQFESHALFYFAQGTSVLFAVAGAAALIAAPWTSGLTPRGDIYASIVWILVIWTAAHVALGVIMQLYCLARRMAGRMTGRYDQDIVNVAVYWHFVAITALITVVVIAGFPLVV